MSNELTKKWNPIEFSDEESKEAIKLIQEHFKGNKLINQFIQHHKDLEYFTTTSDGFWATEFPEKVSDPEKTLFQLKFRE